jgi:hypothetical protein
MAEYSAEDYAKANRLNAKLASRYDPALAAEARELAAKMIEHVKSKVPDFNGFVERVHLSEQYSLTEARQPEKIEKEMKVIFVRAQTLLETAAEAESRARNRAN